MIRKYMDDLEERLDPAVEEQVLSQWKAFCDGQSGEGIFSPRRSTTAPPRVEWPAVTINDGFKDFDRMAIQQLAACSRVLASGSGACLGVRSNYGTGILPSVFGAEIFYMDDASNTLPASISLPGGRDDITRLLDAGVPDLSLGFGPATLRMGAHFRHLFADYPKISRYVHIYHPDLQGPMDACELLWGSSIFLDIMDNPDLVKSFLELVTVTYIKFMREWFRVAPKTTPAGYCVHWQHFHKGSIMIRNDSAMNFGPDIFYEFMAPYDERLFNEFGGGAVHFCGKGDHYVPRMSSVRGLHAVNLTQPHLNEMETIYRHTIDRGIVLLGLNRKAADEAVMRGRPIHGAIHCD